MQEAFAKLKGVDIFSLKSYMEPTNFGSFNGAWVLFPPHSYSRKD